MYEVIFYLDKRERCPAEEFLDQLELRIKAKVEKWMEKLGEEGAELTKTICGRCKRQNSGAEN